MLSFINDSCKDRIIYCVESKSAFPVFRHVHFVQSKVRVQNGHFATHSYRHNRKTLYMAWISMQERAVAVGTVLAGSFLRQVQSLRNQSRFFLHSSLFFQTKMVWINRQISFASCLMLLVTFNQTLRHFGHIGRNFRAPEVFEMCPAGPDDGLQPTTRTGALLSPIHENDL